MTRTRNENYFCEDDPGEVTYGMKSPRYSVTDAEVEVLRAAARNRLVLEIGTGLGVSTRAMASTARWMMTVDVDPWVAENVWPEIRKQYNFVQCVNSVIEDREIVDMALVDGDHRHDAVVKDLEICRRIVRPFGPIFMHDYFGEVQEAAEKSDFVVCRSWGGQTNMVVGVLV